MPQVLGDLIEACLQNRPSQELAELVLQDAVLAARVIQAAGKTDGREVVSEEPVSSAVRRLGCSLLISIALQAAREVLAREWSDQQLSFQYGLWKSSRVGAVAAQCLAPSVNYPAIEEAQVCGLFLNLGIHLLAARHGAAYAGDELTPWGAAGQCRAERQHYGIDHLQIAEQLIEQWRLDSFLVDAIRFLDAAPEQLEQSGQLLKIASLTRQFCASPEQVNDTLEQLAERFFGLRKSETDYLFNWASGLFPAFRDSTRPAELRKDLNAAGKRLSDLIFMLADQEAVRARLHQADTPEALVGIGRTLYLENSPAEEALFFVRDDQSGQLSGVGAGPQQRLVNQLNIPQSPAQGLLPRALESATPCDSQAPEQPLSVTDQLLIRLCRGRHISCHPLFSEGRVLGGVVLGCALDEDLEALDTLRIRMLDQLFGAVLAQFSGGGQGLADASGLLRRVNHEVNGPLTVIANYAEVLRHALTDREHQQLTTSIKTESRRIHDIIHYYLNQQEMPDFLEESVDLNLLVRETCAALSDSELKPRRIVTRLHLNEDLDKLLTNPVLVKQILANLLKNAAEALPEGGTVKLQTRASYLSDGGRHAEVIVEDDGPGLAPQVRDKLFQPVASTKGPGHGGVGLSIVKSMVDDLGGRIACYSGAEGGTSFHVQLPYGQAGRFNSRRSS